MMGQLIDLSGIEFWLVLLFAVFLLTPIVSPLPRSFAFAALNIGFIALLLGQQALAVLAGVLAVNLALHAVYGSRFRTTLALCAGLLVLLLFVLHKLPARAEHLGLKPVALTLSTIGFSYVTLRLVEVLRAVFERRHAPPDLPSLVNYLLPFHMLAAGPIQSYDEFTAQPAVPEEPTRDRVLAAVERIATGLFKKFVLAYLLRKLFLTDFEAGGLYFVLEVQVFFLWLFLDFSAYSDIAVGVGRLIGVATPENFNRPYLARNAIDFWERWHISLSMFIRRNIFIPVQLHLSRRTGGSRPLLCASLAFTVAFTLCGLWHGLTVNFLLWGLIHAGGLVVANLYRFALKKRLGTRGTKRYLANPWIRLAARFVTYQFVALSLVVLFYPRW